MKNKQFTHIDHNITIHHIGDSIEIIPCHNNTNHSLVTKTIDNDPNKAIIQTYDRDKIIKSEREGGGARDII